MKKKSQVFKALVFNPVIVIIYIVFCYNLYVLAQYGGVTRRAPFIAGALVLLVIWFIGSVVVHFRRKRQPSLTEDTENTQTPREKVSRWWLIAAALIFMTTTVLTGYQIYQSAINYQGRLAWFIEETRNRRYVEFPQNNLFEHGLEGLLNAFDDEVPLPDDLYVSNEFELTYTADGEITSFYASLYGENDESEQESFLVSYDKSDSEDISIWLNGLSTSELDEQKALNPFREMVKKIPFAEISSSWNQETYALLYAGVRSWGYNSEGIAYFDETGEMRELETVEEEIVGYAVSVYAPNDPSITPARFLDFTPEYATYDEEASLNEINDTFFVNEKLGYQLFVVDAATGSRFYSLNRTLDGGESWVTINPDPFLGSTGVSNGLSFINEGLGFIVMSRGGGTEGQLFRTTDGGFTFERVELPDLTRYLTDTETYTPFVLPEPPYEENGTLYLEVGQGPSGDFNRGVKALLRSDDNGETWEFLEEVE